MSEDKPGNGDAPPTDSDVVSSVLLVEHAGGKKEIRVNAPTMMHAMGLLTYAQLRIAADISAKDRKSDESKILKPTLVGLGGGPIGQ